MSFDERFALMNAIRDSLVGDDSGPMISEELRKELDRRLAEHAANPNDAIPWEIVKAEALARCRK
ncbi:MAG TPA: addiction module protein [Pirellulales bacterium]